MLAAIFIDISGGILSSDECEMPDLMSYVIKVVYLHENVKLKKMLLRKVSDKI